MSYDATGQAPLVVMDLNEHPSVLTVFSAAAVPASFPDHTGFHMHNTHTFALAIVTAVLALGGCSGMSRSEVSTATGAAVGAVAGAAVGGTAATVGGAVIGGVVGHEVAKKK